MIPPRRIKKKAAAPIQNHRRRPGTVGLSSSSHTSRDKKHLCECIDNADEYVQVCEYLSTVANERDVLRKEDQLLATTLPHPANPFDPLFPRLLFVDVLSMVVDKLHK